MSRKEAIVIASRALAVLMTIWALSDLCSLPAYIHSFQHYMSRDTAPFPTIEYYQRQNLLSLSFLVTKIIGFSLVARWLYKGGPEVEELLFPSTPEKPSTVS